MVAIVMIGVVWLVIGIALAIAFGNMAERKGYSAAAFGALVFFLGVIGMIVVAFLPDKRAREEREAKQHAELVAALQSQAVGMAVVPRQPLGVEMAKVAVSAGLPDPQKPIAPGRYERLTEDDRMLYTTGSPILIEMSALLKNTQTGAIMAQVTFRSISDEPIFAVVADVGAEDIIGERLQGVDGFQYLDLKATRGERFGSQTPVHLPDARTRTLTVHVRKVIFADRSRWEAPTEARWEPIPRQQTLEEALGDSELAGQYRREVSAWKEYVPQRNLALIVYAPQEFSDFWLCTCGEVNRRDESSCRYCGVGFERAVRALDRTDLEAHLREFKEEEEQREEQRFESDQAWQYSKLVMCAVAIIIFLLFLFAALVPIGRR
jgi:PAS domain-containing protein